MNQKGRVGCLLCGIQPLLPWTDLCMSEMICILFLSYKGVNQRWIWNFHQCLKSNLSTEALGRLHIREETDLRLDNRVTAFTNLCTHVSVISHGLQGQYLERNCKIWYIFNLIRLFSMKITNKDEITFVLVFWVLAKHSTGLFCHTCGFWQKRWFDFLIATSTKICRTKPPKW